jgi:hypothetical protein
MTLASPGKPASLRTALPPRTDDKEGMARPGTGSRLKAFIALDGEIVPTTEIIQRTWPRKSKWHPEEYRRVRDAMDKPLAGG